MRGQRGMRGQMGISISVLDIGEQEEKQLVLEVEQLVIYKEAAKTGLKEKEKQVKYKEVLYKETQEKTYIVVERKVYQLTRSHINYGPSKTMLKLKVK